MFILSNGSTPEELEKKIVPDYGTLKTYVEALRALKAKIVTTLGSWDLLHVGHIRYLLRARSFGDVLIVGTDTDDAMKRYKGPLRPILPQTERMEMLSYLSCVSIVTPVADIDENGKWQYELLKVVRPDTFIAVEDSYPEEQRADIRRFCGELVVLPRQAENTSSSNIVQVILKQHLLHMLSTVEKR